MENQLLGKCLVRSAKNKAGKRVVIVSGVFEMDGEADDRDEMWAVRLLVDESKRFVNTKNHVFSPEDFLENVDNIQHKSNWTPK